MKKIVIFLSFIGVIISSASTLDEKELNRDRIINILIKQDLLVERDVPQSREARTYRQARKSRISRSGRNSRGVRESRFVRTIYKAPKKKILLSDIKNIKKSYLSKLSK